MEHCPPFPPRGKRHKIHSLGLSGISRDPVYAILLGRGVFLAITSAFDLQGFSAIATALQSIHA